MPIYFTLKRRSVNKDKFGEASEKKIKSSHASRENIKHNTDNLDEPKESTVTLKST